MATTAIVVGFSLLVPTAAEAGPWVEVGDGGLRSDIQILADAGIIRGAVTTWPLAWADIIGDLDRQPGGRELRSHEQAALQRVRAAAAQQTGTGTFIGHARASVASNPVQIRSFDDTPREDGELELGFQYTGDRYAVNLQGSWVLDPQDDREWRIDGSYAAVALGNWTLGLSAQDRWWGPAWQGSLIRSNNARPVLSVSFDRMSTRPFETKWLAWLGHWDLSVQVGQLESDREVPDALLFGMRFNFRPFDSLEIGLSRTAQLCGDGRPCSWSTWKDMLLGNDNKGDNITPENEPGNQLAGFDGRWSHRMFGQPFALYTHWIGEDEAGGFPAKYFGQFGAETWGGLERFGTYRVYFEWADTMCNFALYRGSDDVSPNCTYNNSIYRTGYRYYGRSLGHSFDNDASIYTLGTILTDHSDNTWSLRLGYGKLNRKGSPDQRNTVAQDKTLYREALLTHRRNMAFGQLHLGGGYDYRKDDITGNSDGDLRFFVEWVQRIR